MKKIFYIITILSFTSIQAQNIGGDWYWNSQNDKHSFELYLTTINSTTVKGNYCSVFYNGNKIDYYDEVSNDFCINLNKISPNTYQGTVSSNFSPTSNPGVLKLTYNTSNNTLLLEIITKPTGEYYIPNNIILEK